MVASSSALQPISWPSAQTMRVTLPILEAGSQERQHACLMKLAKKLTLVVVEGVESKPSCFFIIGIKKSGLS